MFDSRHLLESPLETEQAAALMKVHPKAFPQFASNNIVAGQHVGKLWRFRVSDLGRCLPLAVNSEQLSVPSHNL
jgi:hypothetical protein